MQEFFNQRAASRKTPLSCGEVGKVVGLQERDNSAIMKFEPGLNSKRDEI